MPTPTPAPPHRARAWTPRRRLGASLAALGGTSLAWAAAVATNRAMRGVDGTSMLPTLAPGDVVVTTPAAWSRPAHGDLVVLRPGTVGANSSVKRVVSTPGQRVVLLDGQVHSDGTWWAIPAATVVDEDRVWTPGRDEVVVLGDNRAASTDSRTVGPLSVDAIEAVVRARLRPWQTLRGDMHRLEGPRVRPAVRVVVVDPDDRTLLFRVGDVDGVREDWWETPGGGLQPGEDHAGAARRELAEELGVGDVEVRDLEHVTERDSTLHGVELRRIEATWAARVPDQRVSTRGWTPSERHDHHEWRWFERDELHHLGTTHPSDLLLLYDRAIATV